MSANATSRDIADRKFMRRAITLARRAFGDTSPNPMVGAVLVRGGVVIGEGWHHRAGLPHAEIEALRDCESRGAKARGATLYVTLEPCSTHGRTPPCTEAIIQAGIKAVVVGATDPNPKHAGRGLELLRKAGIEIRQSELRAEADELNEAFNCWIVRHRPYVTVKAAMTLDGKIATASGESKWITGEAARREGMRLRRGTDAILVGINTLIADDPSLTYRGTRSADQHVLRRYVIDPLARTPIKAKVASDNHRALTTVVVNQSAPVRRVRALEKQVAVWICPMKEGLDLDWLLEKMGAESITSLLVEGGGETNAGFLLNGHAQRVVFFYAPMILGGREAKKGVAGGGAQSLAEAVQLEEVRYRWLGADLMLSAQVRPR